MIISLPILCIYSAPATKRVHFDLPSGRTASSSSTLDSPADATKYKLEPVDSSTGTIHPPPGPTKHESPYKSTTSTVYAVGLPMATKETKKTSNFGLTTIKLAAQKLFGGTKAEMEIQPVPPRTKDASPDSFASSDSSHVMPVATANPPDKKFEKIRRIAAAKSRMAVDYYKEKIDPYVKLIYDKYVIPNLKKIKSSKMYVQAKKKWDEMIMNIPPCSTTAIHPPPPPTHESFSESTTSTAYVITPPVATKETKQKSKISEKVTKIATAKLKMAMHFYKEKILPYVKPKYEEYIKCNLERIKSSKMYAQAKKMWEEIKNPPVKPPQPPRNQGSDGRVGIGGGGDVGDIAQSIWLFEFFKNLNFQFPDFDLDFPDIDF